MKVFILGSGHVAWHIAQQLQSCTAIELLGFYSPQGALKQANMAPLPWVDIHQQPVDADIVIAAVSDDALHHVATYTISAPFWVHTAGAGHWPEVALSTTRKFGVVYPLQTFSQHKPMEWASIPILLEWPDMAIPSAIQTLADALSPRQHRVNAAQRLALHTAAVFACNFANHCYAIADDLCQRAEVPFETLHPLIQETAAKIGVLRPFEAQTGPALRGDQSTLAQHAQQLTDTPWNALYQQMTASIQMLHKNSK